MRAMRLTAVLVALLAAGGSGVAQARPQTAGACSQLRKLKNVFPDARAIGFRERLHIKTQEARWPVWPGRCGAFWTTYKRNGQSVDVSVTLYKGAKGVGAALAEPLFGATHVLANGARVRTQGPTPGDVNGTPATSTWAVSAFRTLFVSSTSISTASTPVSVPVQLSVHRRIEAAFARLQRNH